MTIREPADRLSAGDAAVQLRRLVTGESTDAGTAATVAMAAPGAIEDWEPTAVMGATETLQPTAVLGATETLDPTAILHPTATLGATKVSTTPNPGADAPTEFLTPAGPPARSPGSDRAAAATTTTATAAATTATAAPAWRRPRVLVSLGVLAALIVLAVVVFTPRAAEPAAPAATYPAVDGSLGTNLKQLQESVTP